MTATTATRTPDPLPLPLPAAIAQRVAAWTARPERGGLLERSFLFRDFGRAFAFMTQVALFAERHDHHPEWSNVYNRVHVVLTTHDAGGLSARDVEMAAFMDRAYASFSGPDD